MISFLSRAKAVLDLLDRFLALFATMMIEQRSATNRRVPLNGRSALIEQMAHAQSILVKRRLKLKTSMTPDSADTFTRELANLAHDMSQFEFNLSHLSNSSTYNDLLEAIHVQARDLNIDLMKSEDGKAAFTKELNSRDS